MEIDLNKLRDRAYSIAKAHGFHEKEVSDETYLMLIITEISEAVNADRKGHHANLKEFEFYEKQNEDKRFSSGFNEKNFREFYEFFIKDSVEDELADVAIRLFDFAGATNTDLGTVKYTPNSDIYRGNKLLPESCFILVERVVCICRNLFPSSINISLRDIIRTVFGLAESYGINLDRFIDLKMRYNESRPYKNGKEY